MREIRPSGLEGGGRLIPHPYPYHTPKPAHAILRGGLVLGVILHAGDVHEHDRVIAHDPGVMARRDPGNVTGAEFLFAAAVHDNMQAPRDVVLQVSCLAGLGFYERLDARGPFPAGLQSRAPEGDVVDGYQFNLALVKRTGVVWTSHTLLLHPCS